MLTYKGEKQGSLSYHNQAPLRCLILRKNGKETCWILREHAFKDSDFEKKMTTACTRAKL